MSETWIREWVEAHRWVVLSALVGVILVGVGVFWTRTEDEQAQVRVLSVASTASAELTVDVGGEVVKPGVYKLPNGSRVEDAVRVAGGVTGEADANYIEKYLNRAAKVSDGQKIYIPQKSEVGSASGWRSQESATVNINSASRGELEALPGIGPGRVGKIEAGRPYQSVSELIERKIVGSKVYDQIRDKISIW